ncbi:gag-polypeptide of LTR copia-type domain-containing protein [Hirsutella rhossiliensis]
MGKKDYKGTILDGRDSFDSWKMDLEDNLLSDDLMSCVTVNHLTDPRAIYQSLVKRYATSNKARLRQLIRMLYDVSTQTNRTVQEKVDDLKRLRAQINSQDKDIVIHEQLLICFLQMSMDDAFNTTVEILNASTETLTMEKCMEQRNNRSKAQDGGDDSKEEYLKKAGVLVLWRYAFQA